MYMYMYMTHFKYTHNTHWETGRVRQVTPYIYSIYVELAPHIVLYVHVHVHVYVYAGVTVQHVP